MHLGRFRTPALREWVALLMLPALALRLLVPAGFMPSFGEGASFTMTMCHGDPLSSVVVRLTGKDGGRESGDGGQRHDTPCSFAASSTLSAATTVTLATAATFAAEPPPGSPPATLRPAGRHRPQSARAPPIAI
jgi:hypothetical protein